MEPESRNCCSGEPKCKDLHACDYYTQNAQKPIHLGGIYERDPTADVPPKTCASPAAAESDHELGRQQERLQKCKVNAQAWAGSFRVDPPSKKESVECLNSEMALAKRQLLTKQEALPDQVLKHFGEMRVTSKGRAPTKKTPPVYSGLLKDRKFPEYPTELHMKRVCKPRERSSVPLRTWEQGRGTSVTNIVAKFSPSPSVSGTDELSLSESAARDSTGTTAFSKDRKKSRRDSNMPVSSEDMIREYIQKFNLHTLMEYFLSLVCLMTPDNPFKFISELVAKMVRARTDEEEFRKLERIFHTEHIAALYRLFDKEQYGFVSLSQYKTAMETLGLLTYNMTPAGYDSDKITEETFVTEATKAWDLLLRSFLVV